MRTQFKSSARSISTGYGRSSVISEEQAFDQHTETETAFELDDQTFKQILLLFQKLNQYAMQVNAKAQTSQYRFELQPRDIKTPDERELRTAGWRFKISRHERNRAGQMRPTFEVNYSLVPRFADRPNRLLPQMTARTMHWFLNVSCDPTLMMLNNPTYQLAGFPDPRDPTKILVGESGLIMMNTAGYWFLESLGDCLHAAVPSIVAFRWADDSVKRLTAGEPQVLEVSYSLFSPALKRVDVHEWLTTVEMAYHQNLYYRDGFTRALNLGKLRNVQVERVTSKGRKVGKLHKNGMDTRPLRLTKMYSNGNIKNSLKYEYFIAGATDDSKRAATLKTTFTMHAAFFQNLLQATCRANGNRRPTVADFVKLSLRNAVPVGADNAFARHYASVAAAYDRARLDDFALGELVGFSPAQFATLITDWIDDDPQRQSFIERWMKIDPERPSTDSELAAETNIPVRTIERYRASLREAGLQMRVPYLLVSMLADMRLAAGMTVTDRVQWMKALSQYSRGNPEAAPTFEAVLKRAILSNNKQQLQLLNCAPMHEPTLMTSRLLKATMPASNRFKQLSEAK